LYRESIYAAGDDPPIIERVKTLTPHDRTDRRPDPAIQPPTAAVSQPASSAPIWLLAASGAALLWLAQPPLRLWPLAWVALVPWLLLLQQGNVTRRHYAILYGVGVIYWGLTMQGLRHAHPLMYGPWTAFAAYLAVYPVLWMGLVRVASGSPTGSAEEQARPAFRLPLWVSAPIVWVGLECVRNYFLTGISAVMLGHSQADVPAIIQIADLWGSYGVSFVIVLTNAAIAEAIVTLRRRRLSAAADSAQPHSLFENHLAPNPWLGGGVALATVLATLAYGYWRLAEAEALPQAAAVNLALIGRDEPIVFEQDADRELEIFDAYFRQSYQAAEQAAKQNMTLDAVIWPESMFTGGLPWLAADPTRPIVVPPGLEMSEAEFREIISERQRQFEHRAAQVQTALRQATGQTSGPDLIAGCSVVSYNAPSGGHSGCVHIGPDGRVADWYAKTHLVMFGEYIPAMDYLPWIDRIIPPGMGLLPGKQPVALSVGGLNVSPTICIETAVERVTLNQVRELIARGAAPDLLVNVTNDGWFDGSAVVEHHLRCAQFVAIACRRPLLIAANGGPTAWIDSSGRTVERLSNDAAGSILVTSRLDGRSGLYQRIGDWPARLLALACGILGIIGLRRHRQRRNAPATTPALMACAVQFGTVGYRR